MTRDVSKRRAALLNATAALAALVLVVGTAAHADTVKPMVSLGPVVVANGAAALTGSIGANPSSARLTINGQPVSVNAAGDFTALVDLSGQSALTLALTNPTTGDVTETRIPVTTNLLGAGGVISPSVLDALDQAAVTITKPAGGFLALDGRPLEIAGSVLDKESLAGLTVNGKDVLGTVKPDGTFTETVPGSSDRLVVTATDKQGTSQTSTYDVRQASTPVSTSGVSVAAAGAAGVRVKAVRYRVKGVRTARRLTMTVTVADRYGRLVRNAVVRVHVANFQVRRHFVRGGQQSKKSGAKGTATFVVRVTKRALGKRVFMFALAKTPSATAKRTTSVLLPRAARPRL
jgi:hypothetical protein